MMQMKQRDKNLSMMMMRGTKTDKIQTVVIPFQGSLETSSFQIERDQFFELV